MDAQTTPNGNGGQRQEIADDLLRKMDQCRIQIMPHLITGHSINPFPSCLSGIERGIREPKLASFGPYHKGKDHLLAFEEHKNSFYQKFRERIERSTSDSDLEKQVSGMESSIRDCYSKEITNSMSSKDFNQMMLTDGSFIVELFLQFQEDSDITWPWFNDFNSNTLAADLLKMENQLPFSFLERLFHLSCKTCDHATSSQDLRTLALRFFNQAMGRPSVMVFQNMQQRPKHLLDLFRSSLLPPTPPRDISTTFPKSIQPAELLCKAGITLRRKKADSFLEIDFKKFQIPPFALKIPPVPIDDLTTTMLMNCLAMEQCLLDASKHFTAYIRFMNCLLRQPEDVRLLRTSNIITGIQRDDQHVINFFDSVREKVHLSTRDNYLWQQYSKIDSYYDNFGQYIWSKLVMYDALTLVVSILAATIALCRWLFTWLLPKSC